jgi:hypothetical protein
MPSEAVMTMSSPFCVNLAETASAGDAPASTVAETEATATVHPAVRRKIFPLRFK